MEMKCGTELEARADSCLPWEVRGLWGFSLSELAQSSIPEMEDFYLQYPTLTCAPLKQPETRAARVCSHILEAQPQFQPLLWPGPIPPARVFVQNPNYPSASVFQVLWEKGTPDTPPPGKIGSANPQYRWVRNDTFSLKIVPRAGPAFGSSLVLILDFSVPPSSPQLSVHFSTAPLALLLLVGVGAEGGSLFLTDVACFFL